MLTGNVSFSSQQQLRPLKRAVGQHLEATRRWEEPEDGRSLKVDVVEGISRRDTPIPRPRAVGRMPHRQSSSENVLFLMKETEKVQENVCPVRMRPLAGASDVQQSWDSRPIEPGNTTEAQEG